jgi:hypothetical protein
MRLSNIFEIIFLKKPAEKVHGLADRVHGSGTWVYGIVIQSGLRF